MDAAVLEQMLDGISGQPVVRHGYTGRLRDYEVVVRVVTDSDARESPLRRYLFRHCVGARCLSSVPAEVWKRALDDGTIGQEADAEPEGSAWDEAWHRSPGAEVAPPSDAARRWSQALGIDFHDVFLRTDVYRLNLLFSELLVTEVPHPTTPEAIHPKAGHGTRRGTD
ncbi:hypothetical protein AB0D99_02420 [Streptomyces sp. NPDC047971]|uniref:YxiG-like protein n=1 Tax=Streptomyces sp. NPDC047971 TaxID=3154499 RepID=UPI0033D3324D